MIREEGTWTRSEGSLRCVAGIATPMWSQPSWNKRSACSTPRFSTWTTP